ncbi:MAG: phosphoglycerate dehydrogenase [Sulfobacillus sp.]
MSPMPKILVTEALGPEGLDYLKQHAEVDAHYLLDPVLLPELMDHYDAVIIRSAHRLTRELLTGHPRLRVVARAGAGVDNVDLVAATELGIAVINAPGANAIAAAEHTFGLMLSVIRNIQKGDDHVRQGGWDRQAFLGRELHGRTLGIIGLGRVGREVARIARGFGMPILAYDPYISDEIFKTHGALRAQTLEDLLPKSEVLTIHTPKTGPRLTYPLLKQLPKGAVVINAARGGLMEEDAMDALLEEGHLYGVGMDVFNQEPPSRDFNMFRHPNVVMTPHLGGSTHEALAEVGIMTAKGVISALNGNTPPNVVNVPIPPLESDEFQALDQAAGVVGRIFARAVNPAEGSLILTLSGQIPESASLWLRQRVLAAVLNERLDDRVNTVNALLKAEAQGLHMLIEEKFNPNNPAQLGLRWEGDPESATEVWLTNHLPHLKKVRGIPLDLPWPDRALMTWHHDAPGVVGKVGTLVGQYGINIANLHLGRRVQGQDALMVLTLDAEVPQSLQSDVQAIADIRQVFVFP